MAYTTIDDPELYFQSKLYSGTGSDQSITLDGENNLQPDLIWVKRRDGTGGHGLVDSLRGANKWLASEGTGGEDTSTENITFGSDGFTWNGGNYDRNSSGETYVAWCWKESATAGFDINLHSGTGSSADVSHNLSAVPEIIITKRRSNTQQWFVYTTTTGSQKALFLDSTSAESNQPTAYDALPTSSVINYGNDVAVNGNGDTYVAYLWRSIQGFSKFGSYKGNSSTNGVFCYCGFRPALVILKVSSGTTDHWMMLDAKRPGYNVTNKRLSASADSAESDDIATDFLSNGFKLRFSGGAANGSGNTYIFMAWAESPFVNSNGVPNNAR